jgi:hypothetical protein
MPELEKFAKIFDPQLLHRAKLGGDFVMDYAQTEYLELCDTFLFNKENPVWSEMWKKKGKVWKEREDDYRIVKKEMRHNLTTARKTAEDVCDYVLTELRFNTSECTCRTTIALAQICLVLPSTTVFVERGFSTLNDIKTKRRNRLGEETLQMLMFLRLNNLKTGISDATYTTAAITYLSNPRHGTEQLDELELEMRGFRKQIKEKEEKNGDSDCEDVQEEEHLFAIRVWEMHPGEDPEEEEIVDEGEEECCGGKIKKKKEKERGVEKARKEVKSKKNSKYVFLYLGFF